jgi:hypothetical protein
MSGHIVRLAAFLPQPEPPAFAVGVVVAHVHAQRGLDAGKRIEANPDQRPVAEPDQIAVADGVKQLPCGFGVKDGRFTFLDDMGRAANGGGGIDFWN